MFFLFLSCDIYNTHLYHFAEVLFLLCGCLCIIVYRCLLQDAEYVVSEPQPNNVTQASGNLMIVETAGNLTWQIFELMYCELSSYIMDRR